MTIRRELVEAGAGCGKTYSLVTRFIEALGYNEDGQKIKSSPSFHPDEILCLTFTEAAAEEMLVRVNERLEKLELPELKNNVLKASHISTFHGLCYKLLSPHLEELGYGDSEVSSPSIAKQKREEFLLNQIYRFENKEIFKHIPLKALLDLSIRNWFKNPSLLAEQAEAKLLNFRKTYEEKLTDLKNHLLRAIEEHKFSTDKNPQGWPTLMLQEFESSAPNFSQLNFQKSGSPALNRKDKELARKAQLFRDFHKKGYKRLISSEHIEKEVRAQRELFQYLEKLKQGAGKILDFDAMESEVQKLLNKEDYSFKKPKLLIVDEFQDTSPLQFEILQKLSSEDSEWYFVGDPKQSIYSFRNADISLYRKLRTRLELKSLSTNRRSHKDVLKTMNVIQDTLFSEDSPLDPSPQELGHWEEIVDQKTPQGPALRVFEFEKKENNFNSFVEAYKKRVSEKPGRSHAVLFQNWKHLYAFGQMLSAKNLPHSIQGSEKFLDHHLSELLACYWTQCDSRSVNPARTLLLERWESATHLERLLNFQSLKNEAFPTNFTPMQALQSFTKLLQPLRWEGGREWLSSIERKVSEWEKLKLHLDMPLSELAHYLLKSAKFDDARLEAAQSHSSSKEDVIQLLTIHASKGLEYDCVYLAQPFERYSSKSAEVVGDEDENAANLSFFDAKDQSSLRSLLFQAESLEWENSQKAEKKRLFYVALTRAAQSLDIFITKPNNSSAKPSPLSCLGLHKEEPAYWNQVLKSAQSKFGDKVEWNVIEPTEEEVSSSVDPEELWLLPAQRKEVEPAEHFRGGVSSYLHRHDNESETSEKAEVQPPLALRQQSIAMSEVGNSLHEALSLWDGKEETLETLSQCENPHIKKALQLVREIPELQSYWAAVEKSDSRVQREFPMVISSQDFTLSGVADALFFVEENEVWIIDWKSTSQLGSLLEDKRRKDILAQLELYALAFQKRYTKLRKIAVGIQLKNTLRCEIIIDEKNF